MSPWFRHAAYVVFFTAAARGGTAGEPAVYPEGREKEYAAAAFGELCFLDEKLKFFEAALARRAAYDKALLEPYAERRAALGAIRAALAPRIAEHLRAWRALAAPGGLDPVPLFAALAADLDEAGKRARPLLEWAAAEKLRLPDVPEIPSVHIALPEKLRFGVLLDRWRDEAFPAWRVLGFDHLCLQWRELPRRGNDVDCTALEERLVRNAKLGYRTLLRQAADGPVDFSIWQSAARARWQRSARRMGAALGRHEELLGYALFCGADNRPFSEERGEDGTRAAEAFQAFLSARYGTIDALNAAWRTAYGDFAAIAGPPGARLREYGPVYHDFNRFRQESMVEFLGGCIRALAEADAKHPAALALDETAGRQDAFLAASLPVGFVLCDATAGGAPGADFRAAQAEGIARATGKALWRDRFACMSPESAAGNDAETLSAAINRNIWQALGAGARGIVFFSLDGDAAGAGDALLDRESAWRIIRPESARIPIAISLARTLEPALLDTSAEEPEVGLLDSARTRLFPPAAAAQREARAAIERMLLEEGWSYAVLPEASLAAQPESWRKLRAIVAPGCAYVLAEAADALERYIATGGLLIAVGRGGLLDEAGRPTALSRVFLAKKRTVGRGIAFRAEDLATDRDAVVGLLAQVVGPPRIAVHPRGAVQAFLRKDAKALRLVLVNPSPRRAVDARVTISLKFASARDLIVQAAVPVTAAGGARTAAVSLEPGGVAVLELGTPK